MSPTPVGDATALVFLGHGIGHTVGFWGPTRESWPRSRWLSEGATWAIEVTWMWPPVLLILAAAPSVIDVGVPHGNWRERAIVASAVAAVGIVVFWGTWPETTILLALVLDVVFVALRLLWWPTEEMRGYQ